MNHPTHTRHSFSFSFHPIILLFRAYTSIPKTQTTSLYHLTLTGREKPKKNDVTAIWQFARNMWPCIWIWCSLQETWGLSFRSAFGFGKPLPRELIDLINRKVSRFPNISLWHHFSRCPLSSCTTSEKCATKNKTQALNRSQMNYTFHHIPRTSLWELKES